METLIPRLRSNDSAFIILAHPTSLSHGTFGSYCDWYAMRRRIKRPATNAAE